MPRIEKVFHSPTTRSTKQHDKRRKCKQGRKTLDNLCDNPDDETKNNQVEIHNKLIREIFPHRHQREKMRALYLDSKFQRITKNLQSLGLWKNTIVEHKKRVAKYHEDTGIKTICRELHEVIKTCNEKYHFVGADSESGPNKMFSFFKSFIEGEHYEDKCVLHMAISGHSGKKGETHDKYLNKVRKLINKYKNICNIVEKDPKKQNVMAKAMNLVEVHQCITIGILLPKFNLFLYLIYMNHIYKNKYLEIKTFNQIGGNSPIYQASKIVYDNGDVTRSNHDSSSDTMYQIASCSKFITSIVVAKLYELNVLDYDTDINTYLKKWKCNKDGLTLRHLLTHISGSKDFNGYMGAEPQFPYDQTLDLNIQILNGESYSKPFNIVDNIGEQFSYSGAGYQVIQQVLEEVTGKRLYQLLEQYIFEPLNMNNSTGKLLYENKHDYPLANMDYLYRMYPETAAAGIWMSCNDLLSLITDLLNSYNSNNGTILQQKTVKMITRGERHGLGMFIDGNIFSHSGSNHAYKMHFYCIPENNYIEIYMINHNPKYEPNYVIEESKKIL